MPTWIRSEYVTIGSPPFDNRRAKLPSGVGGLTAAYRQRLVPRISYPGENSKFLNNQVEYVELKGGESFAAKKKTDL